MMMSGDKKAYVLKENFQIRKKLERNEKNDFIIPNKIYQKTIHIELYDLNSFKQRRNKVCTAINYINKDKKKKLLEKNNNEEEQEDGRGGGKLTDSDVHHGDNSRNNDTSSYINNNNVINYKENAIIDDYFECNIDNLNYVPMKINLNMLELYEGNDPVKIMTDKVNNFFQKILYENNKIYLDISNINESRHLAKLFLLFVPVFHSKGIQVLTKNSTLAKDIKNGVIRYAEYINPTISWSQYWEDHEAKKQALINYNNKMRELYGYNNFASILKSKDIMIKSKQLPEVYKLFKKKMPMNYDECMDEKIIKEFNDDLEIFKKLCNVISEDENVKVGLPKVLRFDNEDLKNIIINIKKQCVKFSFQTTQSNYEARYIPTEFLLKYNIDMYIALFTDIIKMKNPIKSLTVILKRKFTPIKNDNYTLENYQKIFENIKIGLKKYLSNLNNNDNNENIIYIEDNKNDEYVITYKAREEEEKEEEEEEEDVVRQTKKKKRKEEEKDYYYNDDNNNKKKKINK